MALWPTLTGAQTLDALAALRSGRDRAREADLGPGLDGVFFISCLRLDFLCRSCLFFAYSAFFFRSPIALARAAVEAAATEGTTFRRSRSDLAHQAEVEGRADSDLGLDPNDAEALA